MYIPKMEKKIEQSFFWFWDKSIWIGFIKHSLLLRENTYHWVSYVNKKSEDFRYY